MSVTKRQKEILEFIRDFLASKGYSPTLEEIAERFGISSLNAVYKHLKSLEQRGYIRRLSNQARSIHIVEPDSGPATLPLLGRVAAGQPIEAINLPEDIAVPPTFLTRGDNFVLRVQGDSMIEEQIRDGDYVVLEKRERAENGEIVIALIDGESATLKKFYREGDHIRLQPANPAMAALVLSEDRVAVQGVVVGLLRRY